MHRALKTGDFVEFDAEMVDGRIVKKGGRLIYTDGTVVAFQLSPDRGPDNSILSDRATAGEHTFLEIRSHT